MKPNMLIRPFDKTFRTPLGIKLMMWRHMDMQCGISVGAAVSFVLNDPYVVAIYCYISLIVYDPYPFSLELPWHAVIMSVFT